ncbi:MAG: ArsA family ATPase [Polyangiales bacterium]
MTLAHLLQAHRVVICLGSGGVGKTTTAAALSLHAARAGQRVLCLTIDPAQRLATSLGLDHFSAEAERVQPAHFARQGLQCQGELWASTLDPRATFDALVRQYAPSPELAARLLANRYYQHIAASLSGTREYMALERLYALQAQPQWDLLVLDTPPTSNALDFLDAPERLIDAIDSPASHWLTQVAARQRGAPFGLLSRSVALVLGALARFTGVEFLHQVATLVRDLNALFGGFRARASEVQAVLRAASTAFIVVARPHVEAQVDLPLLRQGLASRQLRLQATLVNGVHPMPLAIDRQAARAALQAEAPPLPPTLLDKTFAAYDAACEAGVHDRAALQSIRALQPDLPLFCIPAMTEEVYDLAALAQVTEQAFTV